MHPLSNELSVVMALGQWLPLQSKKRGSLPEMRSYMAGQPFSKPICAKEERNGLPSADQGLFKAEPRDCHAVFTLHLPPPVPPFLLAQNLSPKGTAGSDITS